MKGLDGMDPALFRGMTQRRMSRRDLFKYTGAGAGALSLAAILEACSKGSSTTPGASSSAASFDWSSQHLNHVLNFANWPLYMDVSHGTHPTLDTFTKETGIKVNYYEVINDNQEFFAKIQPILAAGKATPYDLMVLTNSSQLSELIANNWLIPLDLDKLPNFKQNASPLVKDPAYDPGNTYTIAWQSGFTGIGYSPKATEALGREPNSVKDLFDPRLKGHVGMMSDNTELGSVGMLYLGIEPSTSTPDDWNKAAQVLQQQKDAGIPRGYYGQPYIHELKEGNTWITQAWSGDIFIANQGSYPDLKFLVPQEGVMVWTDNMMIPAHAANPLDALTYMNYVYEPQVAALLADYIWYVTPVPAAKPIVEKLPGGQDVANSPLVFPTPSMDEQAHQYYTFKGTSDLNQWNGIFDPIING